MKRSLLLLSVAALAGCSSASAGADVGTRHSTVRLETNTATHEVDLTHNPTVLLREVDASVDRVWEVLEEVYAALGLRNARFDAERRTATVDRLALNRNLGRLRLSQVLECGATLSMANADQYAVTLVASTRLVPLGENSTRIESVVSASARPMDTSGGVNCTSKGLLERRIAEEVRARI